MPNNREAFEAAYRKAYPVTCELAPDVFETECDEYKRITVQVGWIMWQAGAQAERARINAEHASKVPQVEMAKLQSAVKVLRDRSAP